jgi:hypothetical protein
MSCVIEEMKHSFTGSISYFDSQVWSRYIDVPDDIVQQFKKIGAKRFLCTFNDEVTKHCALLSHGDGRYFVMINQEEFKKLGFDIDQEVSITLEEDKSDYGMPMPEEMRELLHQDPIANKYFHSLTPGKQRGLLYIIGKPKGTETRLRKAITVCEYLKSSQGNLDYRELNQAFKDSRFKL